MSDSTTPICWLPEPPAEATDSESKDIIIDFHGVAGLIDAVAGAGPDRLRTLFRVLRSAEERLEARVVVEVAVRCRDPLAPLATLCHDALRAAADFDLLLRSRAWPSVRQLCPDARAAALLNLCDATLAAAGRKNQPRRLRCLEIRPRLESAALAERREQAAAMARVEAERDARHPGYWQLLETFLTEVGSARAARR